MWETKGRASNFSQNIVGIFSEEDKIIDCFKDKMIKNIDNCTSHYNVLAGLSSLSESKEKFPIIYNIPKDKLNELHAGDVLLLKHSGEVQRMWSADSTQNVLFLTEKCNSACIMCPQPQLQIDHGDEVLSVLAHIQKDELHDICISGGEPTVSEKLDCILETLKSFPNVSPIILTNGRKFKDIDFTIKIVNSAPKNMVYAIPLYSSVSEIHDAIVGVKGAFDETIRGIYNLTKLMVPVEIRIVMIKQNIESIQELANFIGWNLPMTIHVAFMGMEVHGRANDNLDSVWVEPIEYGQALVKAVCELANRDIPVSVYNVPLCLLPTAIHKYSRMSISDWKKMSVEECSKCSKRNECCGLFATSSRLPIGIKAI